MFDASYFYDLVSGRKRGVSAPLVRGALHLAEFPYRWVVRRRNRRYDLGREEIVRVEVPVISVGNLTLGGTGKTPMVKWIARHLRKTSHLRKKGWRVALLSRGYGAEEGSKNDEALELEQALPDVPHLQSPNRVAIAQTAIEELESQVLVLDDGFQHRRLARDLDIVLLDATQPFGYDHVFPRGTLREPVESLARADVVCLSRADLIEADQRAAIESRVEQLAPQALWCEATHAPSQLLNSDGETRPLEQLSGESVMGFCGIGNPAAFRHTLESAGAEVVAWHAFADHHSYTADDVAMLCQEAEKSGATQMVCTHKDLVKIRTPQLAKLPLWAVVVEIHFLRGEEELARRLDALMEGE